MTNVSDGYFHQTLDKGILLSSTSLGSLCRCPVPYDTLVNLRNRAVMHHKVNYIMPEGPKERESLYCVLTESSNSCLRSSSFLSFSSLRR